MFSMAVKVWLAAQGLFSPQTSGLLFNYFVRLSWIHMKLDCKSEQI